MAVAATRPVSDTIEEEHHWSLVVRVSDDWKETTPPPPPSHRQEGEMRKEEKITDVAQKSPQSCVLKHLIGLLKCSPGIYERRVGFQSSLKCLLEVV